MTIGQLEIIVNELACQCLTCLVQTLQWYLVWILLDEVGATGVILLDEVGATGVDSAG